MGEEEIQLRADLLAAKVRVAELLAQNEILIEELTKVYFAVSEGKTPMLTTVFGHPLKAVYELIQKHGDTAGGSDD